MVDAPGVLFFARPADGDEGAGCCSFLLDDDDDPPLL